MQAWQAPGGWGGGPLCGSGEPLLEGAPAAGWMAGWLWSAGRELSCKATQWPGACVPFPSSPPPTLGLLSLLGYPTDSSQVLLLLALPSSMYQREWAKCGLMRADVPSHSLGPVRSPGASQGQQVPSSFPETKPQREIESVRLICSVHKNSEESKVNDSFDSPKFLASQGPAE